MSNEAEEEEEVDATQRSRTPEPLLPTQSTQHSHRSTVSKGSTAHHSVLTPAGIRVSKELAPERKKLPLLPRTPTVSSRRIEYIRPKFLSREQLSLMPRRRRSNDTLKKERSFLDRLEDHRGKRLQRFCYCKDTCKAKIKELCTSSYYSLKKYLRAVSVVCCPPLCTVPNRIAFWPPPRAYFFFRPTEPQPSPEQTRRRRRKRRKRAPTREEEADDDDDWVAELVARKKTYTKLHKATREATEGLWQIGILHDCMDDVRGVEGFVLETSQGSLIACCSVAYRKRKSRYTILYSHPSGSDISDHLLSVPSLQDMARFYRCDVYSYDYSGYGLSTGSPGEKNQNADIRALYEHLVDARHIPPAKIVLMGYSIGTSASVDLIAIMDEEGEEPPAGLILEAPPLSILRLLLWSRGCFNDPWREKSCCMDRYSTFDKIGQVKVPVLVIHGHEDQMVPFSHGKVVQTRAPQPVEPCFLVKADHDNLENFREVWIRIRHFLRHEVRGAEPAGRQRAPSQEALPPPVAPDRKAEKPRREQTKQQKTTAGAGGRGCSPAAATTKDGEPERSRKKSSSRGPGAKEKQE